MNLLKDRLIDSVDNERSDARRDRIPGDCQRHEQPGSDDNEQDQHVTGAVHRSPFTLFAPYWLNHDVQPRGGAEAHPRYAIKPPIPCPMRLVPSRTITTAVIAATLRSSHVPPDREESIAPLVTEDADDQRDQDADRADHHKDANRHGQVAIFQARLTDHAGRRRDEGEILEAEVGKEESETERAGDAPLVDQPCPPTSAPDLPHPEAAAAIPRWRRG